jgi:hypothetical protein
LVEQEIAASELPVVEQVLAADTARTELLAEEAALLAAIGAGEGGDEGGGGGGDGGGEVASASLDEARKPFHQISLLVFPPRAPRWPSTAAMTFARQLCQLALSPLGKGATAIRHRPSVVRCKTMGRKLTVKSDFRTETSAECLRTVCLICA